MPAIRRTATTRSRATTAGTLAAASLVLALPALTGCDAVQRAVDCAQLAVEVSDDVNDLQDALTGAAVNPEDADKVIDTLDENLAEIDDRTDNADVAKAVDDLQQAVDNVRTAVDNGDETPDLTPVADAMAELTNVCSPG
ncbi:hypothetical protein [Streptomyces sp. NPDC018031]|uniref:hypothetical protein n=1 Tax=Streptomyces sp. NPDC018031 TaxID=3365033 RepID=UPI0037A9DD39